jgi:hypothetical protein
MVSTGEAELTALAQSPADERRAAALAKILDARAAADSDFAAALASWWELASRVNVSGNVTNTISGGTQHGPVLQGRFFREGGTGKAAGQGVRDPRHRADDADAGRRRAGGDRGAGRGPGDGAVGARMATGVAAA